MKDAHEQASPDPIELPPEGLRRGNLRQMPCAERIRLLDRYVKASCRFSDSVGQLKNAANSYETDDFNRAFEGCETARRHCLDACTQVYEHIRRHRCALSVPRMQRG